MARCLSIWPYFSWFNFIILEQKQYKLFDFSKYCDSIACRQIVAEWIYRLSMSAIQFCYLFLGWIDIVTYTKSTELCLYILSCCNVIRIIIFHPSNSIALVDQNWTKKKSEIKQPKTLALIKSSGLNQPKFTLKNIHLIFIPKNRNLKKKCLKFILKFLSKKKTKLNWNLKIWDN